MATGRVLNVFTWHRLPPWLAVISLWTFREDLRRKNLYDTERRPDPEAPAPPKPLPHQLHWRTADGRFNDLNRPDMGREDARFGRNMPL
jgi:hypothetical protein